MAEHVNGMSSPAHPGAAAVLNEVVDHLNLRDLLLERGTSGLKRAGGYVRDEPLQDLIGWAGLAKFREMKDTSPVIGACLTAIDARIRKVEWQCTPADATEEAAKYADLVSGMLFEDLDMSWDLQISETLSFLWAGFNFQEIVLKRRLGDDPPRNRDGSKPLPSKFNDGLIGFGRIATRGQETVLRWEFDQAGALLGMHQIDPWMGRQAYIPYEKAVLFRPMSYKSNPEGRSVLRSAYRCFSDDTELLTARGWTSVADIRMEDTLATLRSDGVMEYHRPSALHAYAYEGEMLHMHSRCLDQLVTPNHHVYIKPEYHGAPYRLAEAQTISQRSCFKRDALWDAPDVPTYKIPAWIDGNGHVWPTREVPMDTWLEFLAIYLAEGHTYHSRRGQRLVGITQKRGWKCDRIRQIVQAIGFPVFEHRQRAGDKIVFEILRGQLFTLLRPLGKSTEKYIPDYVKQVSARQMRLFLDVYLLGDGVAAYTPQRSDGTIHKNGPSLYTSSSQMADDLMELAIKAGYVTTKSWQKRPTPPAYGIYRIPLHEPSTNGYLATHFNTMPYEGDVYCVTVPNHTVLARRNGKACWSGNSYYMVTHIENTEAIGIERDLTGLPTFGVPPQWWSGSATPEDMAQLEAIKGIGRNIRNDSQSCLVYPLIYDQNGNQLFRFDLASSSGTKAINTDPIIQRYELRIAQALLSDLLFLGHENTGSFALADTKATTETLSLGGYMRVIQDEYNRRAIPMIWKVNAFPKAMMPQLTHGDIEPVDLGDLARFILSFGRVFNLNDLENHIRGLAGWPIRPDAATNPLPPSILPPGAGGPGGQGQPGTTGIGGSHGGGSGLESGTGSDVEGTGPPDLDRDMYPPSLSLT